MNTSDVKLFKKVWFLTLFTIFYNIAEGVVSMILGYRDETLALFGFGADSFIEVISASGILIMLVRIKRNNGKSNNEPEILALRITGLAFYLLSAGLFSGIILNLINHHKPETTLWGIIISSVSIISMTWLYRSKLNAGRKLKSQPVIYDANCTKICIYMSLVLLASSLIYELTGFAYADIIGTAGLIYFSASEGVEALNEAREKKSA